MNERKKVNHADDRVEGRHQPDTIIKAVKRMKKTAPQRLVEDLLAATSPDSLRSIREARWVFKAGCVKFHEGVFGR
jgi:hypothetical protein